MEVSKGAVNGGSFAGGKTYPVNTKEATNVPKSALFQGREVSRNQSGFGVPERLSLQVVRTALRISTRSFSRASARRFHLGNSQNNGWNTCGNASASLSQIALSKIGSAFSG